MKLQLGLASLILGLFPSVVFAQVQGKSVGELAPSLQLDSFYNSEQFTLEEKRGDFVVLLFWGSYYKEFHPYLEELNTFAHEMGCKGVTFLGISSEEPSQLAKNAKELGITFPLATDSTTSSFSRYGVSKIPFAVVIDPDGVIAWTGLPYDASGFHKALRDLRNSPRTRLLKELRTRINEAQESERKGEFSSAIQAWKSASETSGVDSNLDRVVQSGLANLEDQAAKEIDQYRAQIRAGALLEGVSGLEDTLKKFRGSRAASSADVECQRLKSSPRFLKEKEAGSLLSKAKTDLETGRRVEAAEALIQFESRMKGASVYSEGVSLLQGLRSEQKDWAEIENQICSKEIRGLENLLTAARNVGQMKLALEYESRISGLKARLKAEKEKSLVSVNSKK